MEKAEFIVDSKDWKSFYKMSYNGQKERFLAFSSLVEGTIQFKLGALFPEMSKAIKEIDLGSLDELNKKLKSATRKVLKGTEIPKDYKKFAEMWITIELLKNAGVKVVPEKKELQKILKKI